MHKNKEKYINDEMRKMYIEKVKQFEKQRKFKEQQIAIKVATDITVCAINRIMYLGAFSK